MRVLLVFSLNDVVSAEKPLRTPESIQLGLSYISSLLQKNGHQTRLIVASRVFRAQAIQFLDQTLDEFAPDVVGFSAVSSEYPFISDLARHVRTRRNPVKLLLGGAHASLEPANCIDLFDAVCIGEGEYPVLEYLTQLEHGYQPTQIANLWIRHPENRIEQNPQRPFLHALDELPWPDRAMWSKWIDEESTARPSVLLGRGCPFQCTYCCHHKFREFGSGAYVRFRSPQAIAAEIAKIARDHPHYREIYLEQETIGVKLDWTDALCDALAEMNRQQPRPLTFGVNLAITPKLDYPRLFSALKRANVRYVNIGLESGSERLRRDVLRRKYSNQDVFTAVTCARKHGLQVAMFNMIGLPTETPAEFHQTVEINRRCQPDWHYTSIFYPYPGTDLYRLCQEQNLLPTQTGPIGIDMERSQATLDLPGFSRQQIQRSYEWFDYNVYAGHKPRHRLLAKVLRSKIKSRPKLNRLFRLAVKTRIGKPLERMLNPFVQRTAPASGC